MNRKCSGRTLCESRPLEISKGRYLRFSWHNGHAQMIHDAGSVSTGAGMHSPHPLLTTVKA
jgi:hypothetical protein